MSKLGLNVLKVIFIFFQLSILSFGYAQNGINYKALIKDDSGNVVANQSISIQFIILEDVTPVYQETHNPVTDDNGIIIVNIGEGTPISGDFSTIDWRSNQHLLNVQVDIGSGIVDMGTTEFKAVPYALSSADVVWTKSGDDIYRELGNVGIGTNGPSQKLEVQGKIKIGDDSSPAEEGTIRYNTSSNDFEGYDGANYKSFTKTENTHVDSQVISFSTNVRDSSIPTGAEIALTETGLYLILFKCTFKGLTSGASNLPYDSNITLTLRVETISGSTFNADSVRQQAFVDNGSTNITSRWRDREHLSDFIHTYRSEGTIFSLFVTVSSPSGATNNYTIEEAEIIAIKIGNQI